MTLYGIKHCDTVRKARRYLDTRGVHYTFVDFDENAPDTTLLLRWLEKIPLKSLLNTRSTTYRELKLKTRNPNDDEKIVLMAQHNRLIKRPVLETDDDVIVGFDAQRYGEFIEKG
jgi:Spx/MgsR family transcriptional regulator